MQQDIESVNRLTMRSKAHWGYSNDFMESCRDEISLTTENILDSKCVYILAEKKSTLLGYFGLEKLSEANYELVALFVAPDAMGKGIGKLLINHAVQMVSDFSGSSMLIHSDPHAADFYLAAGAIQIGSVESKSIENRLLPLFEINLRRRVTKRTCLSHI
jgi:GNAT superfamily N-acetyltransferase